MDLASPDGLFQPLPSLNPAGPHSAVLIETHLIQLWGVNAMKPVPGVSKGQTGAVVNNKLGSQGRLRSYKNQDDGKCPHVTTNRLFYDHPLQPYFAMVSSRSQ
jgi:hypothetical protein